MSNSLRNDCVFDGIDYKNQTVGGYRIIEFSHIQTFPSGQRAPYWKIICIHCNVEKTLSRHKIINSCQKGCRKCIKDRFSGIDSPLWKDTDIKKVTGIYYQKTKHQAEKRKIPFQITRKEMDAKFIEQNGKCIYTGYDLFFGDNYQNGNASIDRINSKEGYISNNIQWVHKDINIMKWDFSHDQFINICKLITENTK